MKIITLLRDVARHNQIVFFQAKTDRVLTATESTGKQPKTRLTFLRL